MAKKISFVSLFIVSISFFSFFPSLELFAQPAGTATSIDVARLDSRVDHLKTAFLSGRCGGSGVCSNELASIRGSLTGLRKAVKDGDAAILLELDRISRQLDEIGKKIDGLAQMVQGVPQATADLVVPPLNESVGQSRDAVLDELGTQFGDVNEKLNTLLKRGTGQCKTFAALLLDAKEPTVDVSGAVKEGMLACLRQFDLLLKADGLDGLNKLGGYVKGDGVEMYVNQPIEGAGDDGLWRIGTWGAAPLAGLALGIGLTPEKEIHETSAAGASRTRHETDTAKMLENGLIGAASGIGFALIVEGIVALANL